MCRLLQVKLAFVVALIACFSMVSAVQADIIEDFESGYTDGVTIDGTNGWINRIGAGLIADNDGGKDGGWGVTPGSGSSWAGSKKLHGVDFTSNNGVTFDIDVVATGTSTLSTHQTMFVNSASNKYLTVTLAFKDGEDRMVFSCHDGSSATVIGDSDELTLTQGEWYHVSIDWTFGGALYATLADSNGTVIETLGSATAGTNLSGFYTELTYACVYGRSISSFDNLEVLGVVPEPSTLMLLSMGVFGLLAYAWRKRK